ncbi:hypothetical protein [Burkholderia ubonensis]|uniref:hypothetical protein n=1 Tax=Burkholderia ubonensis TaxID=101571 RepID=UPI00075A273F|nr:hypothetical protein [Burkholderia ubonensis]KWB61672.1 hypothetical protein WL39_20545 [Burkholderia ubonensis]KWB68073.1 hypothetical protein WL38_14290 [Burkholderia ubonensis]
MGQAKQRGTREERIALALDRQKREATDLNAVPGPISPVEFLQFRAGLDRLWANLTTPTKINDQVSQFSRSLSSKEPLFLDCQPELWSRQSCCDINVEKYIERHDGRALCGYRIWYNGPIYIEGERHVVWTDGDKTRDVSFVDTGETRILFVPDELGFLEAPGKVRFAFNDDDKALLDQFEAMERAVPMMKASAHQAWETMPTYEQWLSGKRMPNIISGFM